MSAWWSGCASVVASGPRDKSKDAARGVSPGTKPSVSRSGVESKGTSAFRERARFSFGHGSAEVRARRGVVHRVREKAWRKVIAAAASLRSASSHG